MGVSTTSTGVKASVREHRLGITVLLTVVAYAVVFGTFLKYIPYPTIGKGTVELLSEVITSLNALSLLALSAGWYAVRRGNLRRHRQAMLSGVGIILVFLLVYLEKVGGGGIKEFVGPTWVKTFVYFPLLGIHELLSMVAVPLVIYTLLLAATHSIAELPSTRHPQVGKLAASTWILSLALGIVTFLLLNVVFSWTYTTSLPMVGAALP